MTTADFRYSRKLRKTIEKNNNKKLNNDSKVGKNIL